MSVLALASAQLTATMSELYNRGTREGATTKALDEAKKRLKAAELAKTGLEESLYGLQEQIEQLSRYKESEAFERDVVAHIAGRPRKVFEALCSYEEVGRKVIQGFFDSPSANRLLSETLSWAMSMGAA